MHFVYTGSLLLVPLSYAELPLGIQIKNSNGQKIESARGKMGAGEKTSYLSRTFFFFLSPQSPSLPTTQRSLCGGEIASSPSTK